MSSILTCNEDCFHCIYPDCIMDILPSERKAKNIYYQKNKAKKSAYNKTYYQKNKKEIAAKQREKRIKKKETEKEVINNDRMYRK